MDLGGVSLGGNHPVTQINETAAVDYLSLSLKSEHHDNNTSTTVDVCGEQLKQICF